MKKTLIDKAKHYLEKNQKTFYNACCFYPFVFAGSMWSIFKASYVFKHPNESQQIFVQYSFLIGCIISLVLVACIMAITNSFKGWLYLSMINLLAILLLADIQSRNSKSSLIIAFSYFLVIIIMTGGSYSWSYLLTTTLASIKGPKKVSGEWIGFFGTVAAALIGLLGQIMGK